MLSGAGDLTDKVIVSCSLPMNEDNTELVVAHTSSGAEQLAHKVPEARIVGAFNTVPSEVLFSVMRRAGNLDPVDVGPLRVSRYIEPFALLVAEIAYEGQSGPELAYRFERFEAASDSK